MDNFSFEKFDRAGAGPGTDIDAGADLSVLKTLAELVVPTRRLSSLLSPDLLDWARARSAAGLDWDVMAELRTMAAADNFRYLRHQEDQAAVDRARRDLMRTQREALEAAKYLEAASEALKAAAEALAEAVRADVPVQKR